LPNQSRRSLTQETSPIAAPFFLRPNTAAAPVVFFPVFSQSHRSISATATPQRHRQLQYRQGHRPKSKHGRIRRPQARRPDIKVGRLK
jgi:hypothetical protein